MCTDCGRHSAFHEVHHVRDTDNIAHRCQRIDRDLKANTALSKMLVYDLGKPTVILYCTSIAHNCTTILYCTVLYCTMYAKTSASLTPAVAVTCIVLRSLIIIRRGCLRA